MPDIQSYARLFAWFRFDSESLYQGRVELPAMQQLLAHLAALAAHDCQINDELPAMFIDPLRRYHAHNEETRRFFDDADKCAFFLSDFLDFISLYKNMQRRGR